MEFDPENPDQLKRLREAINWSERQMQIRREARLDQLRLMVGDKYGEGGAAVQQPINLIELGVSIFERQISANNLAANVETTYHELLPSATDMQLVLNQELPRMGVKDALNECGFEALFTMGVMKIGLAVEGRPGADDDPTSDPAQVFCDPVLFDNLVVDMRARRWDQMSYVGDYFRVPLEWAVENPMYDPAERKKLKNSPASREREIERGGEWSASEELSQGDPPIVDEFVDCVDLLSVYLPMSNEILTIAAGAEAGILSRKPWEGPRHGPYRRLVYGSVPGNIMPRAVVPYWVDLHEITNRLFRKVSNQAERQKTLLLVQGHAKDDGNRIVNAADGEAILTEDPNAAVEKTTGGANDKSLAMVVWSMQNLFRMGGNWDALGGLSPQSSTVGQDKLLTESASAKVRDMQEKFNAFTSEVISDVAYWIWHNPMSRFRVLKPIAGTQFSIPVDWSAESRVGEFFQYNFSVNPFAMRARSPMEKSSEIVQFVQQILLPILPSLQQSGMALDWEKFFKLFAKYRHLPEINELILYMNGEQHMQRGAADGPGMPPTTTRNYVRENRPTTTQRGTDDVMIRQLLGANQEGPDLSSMMAAS